MPTPRSIIKEMQIKKAREMMEDENICSNDLLACIMIADGISTRRMAEMIDVTPTAIVFWCDKSQKPRLENRKKLFDLFGISMTKWKSRTKGRFKMTCDKCKKEMIIIDWKDGKTQSETIYECPECKHKVREFKKK
jgi:DNA-directed RNA polymerase subunit RPC12/RpoP